MRYRHAIVGLVAASSLGCFSFPDEVAYLSLEYRIERPTVAAIRVDPPVLAHGLPVRVDALLLAPAGFEVESTSVRYCGLRDDLLVEVYGPECFDEPDLIGTAGTEVPLTWDPPDVSGIDCPSDTGDTAVWRDTGRDDTGGDTDDTGTLPPPEQPWSAGSCMSQVPLLVGFEGKKERAYGQLNAQMRIAPYTAGEEVPKGIDAAPRSLEATGDVRAGGEVDLEFRIDADPDWTGFRWWIDDGELLATGRTAIQKVEGETRITNNTLRIPDDYHGPLRIYVVVASETAWYQQHTGDVTWSELVLEVP